MRIATQSALLSLSLAATVPAAAFGEEGETWNCRNVDFEISCADGTCASAESHTPMDIHLSQDEVSWCAYSGCWTGAPSAVVSSGPFETYFGLALTNSAAPDDVANVTVVIDKSTNAATVAAAGQYATPATCELN